MENRRLEPLSRTVVQTRSGDLFRLEKAPHFGRSERSGRCLQARQSRGPADHARGVPSGMTQSAHTRIAVRLAQLLCRRFHDEGVMSEDWRLRTTEQARQHDLPTGGIEQILTSNHQGDSLERVVGGGSPLIGPVSKTITDQEIAALPRRRLLLSPDKRVIEPLVMRLYPHAPTDVVCQRQIAIATSAAVYRAVDLLARTIAGVNEPSSHEGRHGLAIRGITVALPTRGNGRSRRKSRQWRTHPRPKVPCQSPPINGPHRSYKLQVTSYKLRRLSAPQPLPELRNFELNL